MNQTEIIETVSAFDFDLDGETVTITAGQIGDKDLPVLARIIRRFEDEIEQIEQYKKAELERIRDTCLRKQESKQASITFLLNQAEQLIRARGERKYDMPGIGYFGLRKTVQSVLTADYDAMSADQQAECQKSYPDLFSVKTVIAPNKKTIKELLDGATTDTGIPFQMSQQEEKLVFKGE